MIVATDSDVQRFEKRGPQGQRVENSKSPDQKPKGNRQDSGAVSSRNGDKIKKPGSAAKQAGPAISRPALQKGPKPAVVKRGGLYVPKE
jgi:hypothetical protein